jgi:hypothetical protein
VVNVGVRDSTYVLDGLLYHESDLRIEEHYTDTAGFTDHVFALMHLLGFRFAPRIRDLSETKLYIPKRDRQWLVILTSWYLGILVSWYLGLPHLWGWVAFSEDDCTEYRKPSALPKCFIHH